MSRVEPPDEWARPPSSTSRSTTLRPKAGALFSRIWRGDVLKLQAPKNWPNSREGSPGHKTPQHAKSPNNPPTSWAARRKGEAVSRPGEPHYHRRPSPCRIPIAAGGGCTRKWPAYPPPRVFPSRPVPWTPQQTHPRYQHLQPSRSSRCSSGDPRRSSRSDRPCSCLAPPGRAGAAVDRWAALLGPARCPLSGRKIEPAVVPPLSSCCRVCAGAPASSRLSWRPCCAGGGGLLLLPRPGRPRAVLQIQPLLCDHLSWEEHYLHRVRANLLPTRPPSKGHLLPTQTGRLHLF